MRSKAGETSRNSTSNGSPFALRRIPSLPSFHPASMSSFMARRRLLRRSAGVRLTGLRYSFVKTSGGTLSLTFSRISRSRPSGRPVAASSELEKKEFVRVY